MKPQQVIDQTCHEFTKNEFFALALLALDQADVDIHALGQLLDFSVDEMLSFERVENERNENESLESVTVGTIGNAGGEARIYQPTFSE